MLLLNRAKAKTLLDPPDLRSAALDARSAAELQPHWPKAFHRLALIESRLKNYAAAIDACRAGSAAAERAKCMTGEFKHLWDDVAIDAAMDGSLVGFDGRVIFVRSAGEEAWLGREAPEHYAFDGAEDADDVYAKRAKRAGLHDAGCFTGAAPIEPLHARSLVDAMELASDGDRILLLRGVDGPDDGRAPLEPARVVALVRALHDPRRPPPTTVWRDQRTNEWERYKAAKLGGAGTFQLPARA